MKKLLRGPAVWIMLIIFVVLASSLLGTPHVGKQENKPYTDFMKLIKEGEIHTLNVMEYEVQALKVDSEIKEDGFPGDYDYSTRIPNITVFTEDLLNIWDISDLADAPISIKFVPRPELSWFLSSLPYIIVTLAMVGLFWYMMVQQGQGGKMSSFGKSRARVAGDNTETKTFADVAGAEEEKEELSEIVDFLKNPRKYIDLGARVPKGVLLVGPPGTGKTLLAKAVAGEADVPFYSISGSDFVEMFVGVGASRVRDLFDTAKKSAPSIVFIDEIDAVGRQRGAGLGGGHDEREQTLNQLLVEMDGFTQNEGIIVIAATNRADILDPALLRPGRFDRTVTVHYPDIKGREEILKVHSKGKPLDADVDLEALAKRTPYFTGADLENVLNEAAILAARKNMSSINNEIIEEATNRAMLGPEKRSKVVTDKDRQLVAYHEAGHAIVAHAMPNCHPVREVSIIPRGAAGGFTMTVPDEETDYTTKNKLLDDIVMSLGGRAAEELVFGEISTGATSDIKSASKIARKMVTEYGMSEKIGTIYLGNGDEVFLGRDYGHARDYSESVATNIDKEVKRILDESYQKALKTLKEHREMLNNVANALLENDKLNAEQFIAIVGEKSV